MKSKLFAVLAAGGVLLPISGPRFGPHGGAQYDTKHAGTGTGNVTEYMFTNPHVQIHFDVKDDSGKVEKWIAETASPQRLFSFGWNAKTLKPGGQIPVTGAPRQDGQKIVSVIKVVGGNAPALTTGAAE